MNKEQGNYFRMFLNTQDLLDRQISSWSGNPKITSYKNDLDELISMISEKSEDAQSDLKVSNRKKQVKGSLAIKTSSLAGAIQAYAHDAGNYDLVAKVKHSKSDIEQSKDTDVDALVKSVLNIAQQYVEELADYGVTNDLITQILASLVEFNKLIGMPRSILNTKFVKLDSLDLLFRECNDLLRNKLDNIMLMFRELNPEFYDGYERARTIVNR